jgi:CubicO group peptidase (beta-lactamase class C family)
MMKKIMLLLGIVMSALCTPTHAQSKADQIDALVTKFYEYNQFSGSLLVADNGKVIYKEGFGLANRATHTPNGPGTRHRLASVTKQFTAMVIMQLVAEGKLKLDVPITTYLPSYPATTGNQITIHHLLTHSSGIPNYTSFENYREVMVRSMTPGEIVMLFSNEPLEFTPGEKYAYSNSGYVLLGYIIENVTGKPYADVLQQNIFGPLKMINSGYERTDDPAKNKAIGYNQTGSEFEPSQFIDMSIPYAAGALFSSVEDMYLWNEALYTDKLLPKKYLDMVFTPHIPSYNTQHYAYGWEIGTLPVGNSGETVNTIHHSGGINGFVTVNVRIPAERSSITILSNSSSSSLQGMLVAINGILHDKPYDLPKQSLAYNVYDVISNEGIDEAIRWYETERMSSNYYLNENEMNTVGYGLLQSGKAKEAATVFKWNVDAYPQSFNVYDSYAESLLALGDTAQSIVYYKKSLEINPNSEYGIKALRSLGIDPDSFIRKVPIEELLLLAGDYVTTKQANGKEWKISFSVENGVLIGKDGGYRYKLAPQGNNEFINPDDGAVLKFDVSDRNAISLALFGFTFKKV